MIELTGSFDKGLGQHIRVPSRFRKNRTEYKLKLTDVPLLYKDDPLAYSLVWEIAGNCHCEDKSYRSDRHRQKIGQGSREDFYCSHEISAFHTLRKKHENKKKIMSFLPFVMPTASMMNYLERLRHQTIMLTYNSETERWSKRSLNNTEMENLLWKKVMAEGYESNFTTEIDKFKKMKYDPHLDLLNFKR